MANTGTISMLLRLTLSLAFILSCAGCAHGDAHWVRLNGETFVVEVAADDAARTRGLMFRDSMPRDHGMLFVFEKEEPLAFWMKNTRIPLDILYFDASLRLVSVAAGAPPCTTPRCPSYPSQKPARFTLELNAGLAKELGVRPGDSLEVDPSIPALSGLDSR
jgi:uncharacterized membrane protein (UPF0127 family)